MKRLFLTAFAIVSTSTFAQKKYVMVIHGGAGTITKEMMTPEKEKAYKEKLTEALQTGYTDLKSGKSSLDAVQTAIVIMEDSPLFNAGKGAVFTNEGTNELDASIMFGKDKSAGAVAGVTAIKNPIKAAYLVMKNSPHVMMSGKGAEEFAKQQNLEIVDPKYFWTKDRWEGLQKVKQKELEKNKKTASQNVKPDYFLVDQKFGTVGAVALDKDGNISAGTSTGGMTNKKFNRIGDSPIIGAGTYANSLVGISGTGWGEYFIRSTAARTVAAKMEYQNKDIKSAAQETIDEIAKMGGDGGLIALDKDGNIAMPFNTAGMYRGAVTENGEIEIQIYKNETENALEKLVLSVKQNPVKESELKNLKKLDLVITNNSAQEVLYSSYFFVENFNGKSWNKVPFVKNLVFPSIEYSVKANSIGERPLYLNSFQKPLKKGKYRIVRTFENLQKEQKTFQTEFEIN